MITKLRQLDTAITRAVGDPIPPALRAVAEFLANLIYALLDRLVAHLGRVRDVDGHLSPWPVGRHAADAAADPVPPTWSPLDDYDRAVVEHQVRTLCGATT